MLRERAGTETGKVINIRCDKEKDVMSEADHWRAWEEDRSVDGDSVERIMGSDSEGRPRGRGRNASQVTAASPAILQDNGHRPSNQMAAQDEDNTGTRTNTSNME